MLDSCNIITLEGIIGAGKTLLLSKLEKHLANENISNVSLVSEPVDLFKHFLTTEGVVLNPLEMFYQNTKENATAFQFHVLECYDKWLFDLYQSIPNRPWNIIIDRGVYSTKIFCDVLHEQGHLGELDIQLLNKKLETMLCKYFENKKFGTDKIFFLNTSIDTSIAHMKTRNRIEENNVKEMVTYQTLLQKRYIKYLHEFAHKQNSYDNVVTSFSENIDDITKQFSDFVLSSLIS